jgi:hypothetical protein
MPLQSGWTCWPARYQTLYTLQGCRLLHREAVTQDRSSSISAQNNVVLHIDPSLSLQDDAAWKENLIGMGSGPGVPKLLHHNGKVRCL